MAGHGTRAQAQEVDRPLRGGIYLVAFDPAVGSEIQKTRPALVIQNNIANRHSPITIVAALTTKFGEPPYPTEVIVDLKESGLTLRSAVLLNQIRSVDHRRLIKRLGKANAATMQRVDRAIRISSGLD